VNHPQVVVKDTQVSSKPSTSNPQDGRSSETDVAGVPAVKHVTSGPNERRVP